MNLINEIKKFLSGEQVSSIAPDEYCPNCWGRQEYGGNMYEAVKAEGLTADNINIQKGWIQEYAEKYLLGIRLIRKNEKLVCVTCMSSYSK